MDEEPTNTEETPEPTPDTDATTEERVETLEEEQDDLMTYLHEQAQILHELRDEIMGSKNKQSHVEVKEETTIEKPPIETPKIKHKKRGMFY